jgi:hypothetical protein
MCALLEQITDDPGRQKAAVGCFTDGVGVNALTAYPNGSTSGSQSGRKPGEHAGAEYRESRLYPWRPLASRRNERARLRRP